MRPEEKHIEIVMKRTGISCCCALPICSRCWKRHSMKKMETDAVRTKTAAMYTLVKIGNDVPMRDHDSLEERSVYDSEINEVHIINL